MRGLQGIVDEGWGGMLNSGWGSVEDSWCYRRLLEDGEWCGHQMDMGT